MNAHPVCAIFPLLDDLELQALADDIAENGLVEAIVVRDDQILDGRNRLRACELAGVDPEFREWEGDESEIIPWILSKNLHRRHLDTSQRAMVAARLATLADGQRQVGQLAEVPTQAEAAALLNVGERTVRRAREVLEDGNHELARQVDRGELSVSAAAAQTRSDRYQRGLDQLDAEHEAAQLADLDDRAEEADEVPVSESAGYDGDSWSTPDDIIGAAREVLGAIDLDPATNPTAQARIRATVHYTREDDGLAQAWTGRVWLNPPYSEPDPFVTRLVADFDAGAVSAGLILVNNATDTRWFQGLLGRFHACFLGSRIAFLYQGVPRKGARQGQVVFYLGPDPEAFGRVFGRFGVVVAGWPR